MMRTKYIQFSSCTDLFYNSNTMSELLVLVSEDSSTFSSPCIVANWFKKEDCLKALLLSVPLPHLLEVFAFLTLLVVMALGSALSLAVVVSLFVRVFFLLLWVSLQSSIRL